MKDGYTRLRLLDILRGFAILGTMGTNIWIFAHLGDLNYLFTYTHAAWWQSAEDFIRLLVLFFVNGKLLGLLTIMFGIGLEMKYQQSLRKGIAWPGIYIGTSIVLMLEGVIHYTLIMEYDILMSYGITAIITAFIVKRGDNAIRKTMLWIGTIYCTVMLLVLVFSIYLEIVGTPFSIGEMNETVILYRDGSWLEQVIYRVNDFIALRLEAVFIIPMNIFLFLLGVRMMRSGYFSPDEQGKEKRRKLFRIGLYVGVPLNILIFVPGGHFDLPVRYLFAPLMSLGYIGLIAMLVEANDKLRLWRGLEKVGQISLSSYILQNILASAIFYGWGLGLGGKVNAITIVLIWIGICCFQLIFATIWLKVFKYGPMELWRRWMISVISKG